MIGDGGPRTSIPRPRSDPCGDQTFRASLKAIRWSRAAAG